MAAYIISGAVLGAPLGFFLKESENTRFERALNKYDNYLSQVEVAAYSQARVAHHEINTPVRSNYVERLAAEQSQQALRASDISV